MSELAISESKALVALSDVYACLNYVAGMIPGHYSLVSLDEVKGLRAMPGFDSVFMLERSADLDGVVNDRLRHRIASVSHEPGLYRLWPMAEYKEVVARVGVLRARLVAGLAEDKARAEADEASRAAARVAYAEARLLELAAYIADSGKESLEAATARLRALPPEKLATLQAVLLSNED